MTEETTQVENETMEDIESIENELRYLDDDNDVPPADVVAYNEQRSVADIFRLVKRDQLDVSPDFQRDIVWGTPQQSRFIDSLTKQLPIPSMCLSVDLKTDKRIIIDGLQRTSAIVKFLSGSDNNWINEDEIWKLSNIADIDSRLQGATNKDIYDKYSDLFSRVENVMIPITVIRCDYSKPEHMEYIYTIFHRLNSTGTKLNNQEIRNCIYTGNFNQALKSTAGHEEVVALFGENIRFSNQEYLLRVLAFRDRLKEYSGTLSKFLNIYMSHRRKDSEASIDKEMNLLLKSAQLVSSKMLKGKKLPNRTVAEGILYATVKNYDHLTNKSNEELTDLYNKFLQLSEFSPKELSEGLTAKKKVVGRLQAGEKLFSR